jgi:hypothetical protein
VQGYCGIETTLLDVFGAPTPNAGVSKWAAAQVFFEITLNPETPTLGKQKAPEGPLPDGENKQNRKVY